jgi:hypothetical protein
LVELALFVVDLAVFEGGVEVDDLLVGGCSCCEEGALVLGLGFVVEGGEQGGLVGVGGDEGVVEGDGLGEVICVEELVGFF